MSDVKAYCDNTYKRLVGLKAGLFDVMTKAESVSDEVHTEAVEKLKSLVAGIEAGLDELTNQCPSDWSPNKKAMDDKMEELAKTLSDLADHAGVTIPDTTAWV
jgi:anti-sigma factor ChrR (cupin superfamily)